MKKKREEKLIIESAARKRAANLLLHEVFTVKATVQATKVSDSYFLSYKANGSKRE